MKLSRRKLVKNSFIALILAMVVIGASYCFAQVKAQNDSKASSFQYMRKINSVFDFVQQNYVDEIDPVVLYEGALKGMFEALGDPYSVYLDSDYMRDLTDTTEGSFGGVGLTISKPVESTPEKPAYVEVASPLEDSPGAKAGIRAGDLIVAVEGRPTPELTMNEVLGLLRGEVGTPVTITILRGTNMRFDVRLVRALIEVPTAKYGMIEGTKIGYVRLIEFTPETPIRFQDALDSFEENGYKSLIIDLRDNPGGLINSVVDVADKFIDKGVIVSTKSRIAIENMEFKASKDKTTARKNIPIVVLINKGSASASEILSGALKDYKMAYLVGENTYGKGSVQQVRQLSDTDGFKLTMARYYTPSDVNIDKIGIPPDLEITNMESLTKEQEDNYVKLVEDRVIEKLVEDNPEMTEKQIAENAKVISNDTKIDARIIRKIIRNQVTKYSTPLYDLDYDLQLNEAIKIVSNPDFNTLLKKTKTLKQLQQEKEDKELQSKTGNSK
ncbi:MAG: S41 family peptidase [Treponema sp.]|nr:S41 family peptidase [Treponema sp.]MDY3131166.1 S41 family peptidase [Treponema sp.]